MRRSRVLLLAATTAVSVLLLPSAQAAGTATLDMTSAFDKDCVAPRYLAVQGNCDGGLMSGGFVAEAFPSGSVTVKGQAFSFGNGANQAASGNAQVVKAPALKGASFLHVVATAVNAGSTTKGGMVTLTYTNGQTTKADLQAFDWAAQPSKAALSLEAQSISSFGPRSYQRYLFIASIPVNRKFTVASVTLPTAPDLRVFAMTLSSTDVKAGGPAFS